MVEVPRVSLQNIESPHGLNPIPWPFGTSDLGSQAFSPRRLSRPPWADRRFLPCKQRGVLRGGHFRPFLGEPVSGVGPARLGQSTDTLQSKPNIAWKKMSSPAARLADLDAHFRESLAQLHLYRNPCHKFSKSKLKSRSKQTAGPCGVSGFTMSRVRASRLLSTNWIQETSLQGAYGTTREVVFLGNSPSHGKHVGPG